MKRAATIIALSLLALLDGCAQVRPPAPRPSYDEVAVVTSEQQLAREQAALVASTAENRPVDCERARTLRDNICGLAERICALVERDRRIPDGPARCAKARARCQEARARVGGPCGGAAVRRRESAGPAPPSDLL